MRDLGSFASLEDLRQALELVARGKCQRSEQSGCRSAYPPAQGDRWRKNWCPACIATGALEKSPDTSDREISGEDYDRSIHHNPDAAAWTTFFMKQWTKVYPGRQPPDEGWMLGWFANAMMAMHDHIYSERPDVRAYRARLENAIEDKS